MTTIKEVRDIYYYGNHGNQAMSQSPHLTRCLHSGITYSYHLLPSGERVGGAKGQNTANLVQSEA